MTIEWVIASQLPEAGRQCPAEESSRKCPPSRAARRRCRARAVWSLSRGSDEEGQATETTPRPEAPSSPVSESLMTDASTSETSSPGNAFAPSASRRARLRRQRCPSFIDRSPLRRLASCKPPSRRITPREHILESMSVGDIELSASGVSVLEDFRQTVVQIP